MSSLGSMSQSGLSVAQSHDLKAGLRLLTNFQKNSAPSRAWKVPSLTVHCSKIMSPNHLSRTMWYHLVSGFDGVPYGVPISSSSSNGLSSSTTCSS